MTVQIVVEKILPKIDKNKIKEWRTSNDPESIVFTRREQTIAVRFSLQHTFVPLILITGYNGFIFRISPINNAAKNVELSHQFPYQYALLIGFFLSLACFILFYILINNI